jgi:hypothetical protein
LLMLIIGHDASISSEGMEAISCGGRLPGASYVERPSLESAHSDRAFV